MSFHLRGEGGLDINVKSFRFSETLNFCCSPICHILPDSWGSNSKKVHYSWRKVWWQGTPNILYILNAEVVLLIVKGYVYIRTQLVVKIYTLLVGHLERQFSPLTMHFFRISSSTINTSYYSQCLIIQIFLSKDVLEIVNMYRSFSIFIF